MRKYIELTKVLSELGLDHKDYVYIDKHEVAERIKKLPSIDIVFCKECMFADVDAEAEMARCSLVSFPLWHRGDYFCSDGERREP